MFVTVTGGSGSGKSEYSENLLLCLDGDRPVHRIYIATMMPFGEESHRRIFRHREMRKNKGFETIECYTDLAHLKLPEKNGRKPSVLLECMSNLVANEYYGENGAGSETQKTVEAGIRHLLSCSEHLIVVTNEVFSDGIFYDASTEAYKKVLGKINRSMAKIADAFVEVVYGIPIIHKGDLT